MRMRPIPMFALALCVLAACTQKPSAPIEQPDEPAPPGGITPAPIPSGFGFPGDRETLQAWADTWDLAKIRAHAWDLWAGMAADSGQLYKDAALPVWETWCGNEEVFPFTCTEGRARPSRAFQAATQHSHMATIAGTPTPDDTQVVSFNRFNPAMASYLGQQHPGPGSTPYSYTSAESLAALNAAWPAGTSIAERKVVESPAPAIELKPVIYVVKATGLTPLPLWLGTGKSTRPGNATPETWTTCVLTDPEGADGDPAAAPVPATQAQIAQAVENSALACQRYLYAPLATLYHFQMDAQEAAAWNAVSQRSDDSSEGNIQAAAGDYAVLAAMHVNTKEIENWTWQTFWWQPGADTPGGFPGSKAGMTGKVVGAWRNYAMCTAWNQTKGQGSREMVVCFNPYLETSPGIPDGQNSNCMSCHGTATAGKLEGSGSKASLSTLSYPESYTAPIDFDNDPRFASFTRTDFSWAIPSNATLPGSQAEK